MRRLLAVVLVALVWSGLLPAIASAGPGWRWDATHSPQCLSVTEVGELTFTFSWQLDADVACRGGGRRLEWFSFGFTSTDSNAPWNETRSLARETSYTVTFPAHGDYAVHVWAEDEAATFFNWVDGTLTTQDSGLPDATPEVTVTGTSVRLRASNPVNGASQFNWSVQPEGGAPVAQPSGADVTLTLPPGHYTASLSVCRLASPSPLCRVEARVRAFSVTADLAFDVTRVDPLTRKFTVRIPWNSDYTWTVDGTPIGTTSEVTWTAPRAGNYQVAVGADGLVADRTVSIGFGIHTDDTAANDLIRGEATDAACDPVDTVLKVESRIDVWASLTTSASESLVDRPQPGLIATVGLLPPKAVATWAGGCFDAVPQSFQVRVDIADDRALTATALSGFLKTITTGTIDVDALGKAVAAWDNASRWPLPESRAAVAELTKVLRGNGDLPRATGHIWKALTTEPEATRLRALVTDTGAAIPKIGDLVQLAAAVAETWQGTVDNPYELGDRVSVVALGNAKSRVERQHAKAQDGVAAATDTVDKRRARISAVNGQITSHDVDLQATQAKKIALTCNVEIPLCRQQHNRLQTRIDQIRSALDKLRSTTLPDAETRLSKALNALTAAQDNVDALAKAVRCFDYITGFAGQLKSLIDLSALLYKGRRIGASTFSTTR